MFYTAYVLKLLWYWLGVQTRVRQEWTPCQTCGLVQKGVAMFPDSPPLYAVKKSEPGNEIQETT